MGTLLVVTATAAVVIAQTEYVSNVPSRVRSLFDVIGMECNSESDCEDEFPLHGTNTTAMWQCALMNDTQTACLLDECSVDADCDGNEICYFVTHCDADGELWDIYNETTSTLCAADSMCTDLRVEGNWSIDTMCYLDDLDRVYFSVEEAMLCGQECVASEHECIDIDFEKFRQCDSVQTCCSEEHWNQSKCIDMLWQRHQAYILAVAIAAFLICCSLCCCMRYRCQAKKETFEELDTETAHYNVYI